MFLLVNIIKQKSQLSTEVCQINRAFKVRSLSETKINIQIPPNFSRERGKRDSFPFSEGERLAVVFGRETGME
jgi:hypothetical protein